MGCGGLDVGWTQEGLRGRRGRAACSRAASPFRASVQRRQKAGSGGMTLRPPEVTGKRRGAGVGFRNAVDEGDGVAAAFRPSRLRMAVRLPAGRAVPA